MPDMEAATQVEGLPNPKLQKALPEFGMRDEADRQMVLDSPRFCDKFMNAESITAPIRRSSMSIQSHLVELERRHQALEREIQTEQIHPSTSDLKLRELKRKKLHLKQEIERLKVQTVSTALH